MLFVDEDVPTLDQASPFPVVRASSNVVEGAAEAGLEEK
jgi:hypothetical protein